MFIDKVKIFIKAGSGGDGIVSFYRDKMITRGGPDGGNGGRGGSVVFRVTPNQNNLVNFKFEKHFRAADGTAGGKKNMTGKDGDAIAREYLKIAGFDSNFTHSLGHSLGIDIHEPLRLSPKEEKIIPVGAVMSIEPGIYFKGEMGIRIEDIVVFNDKSVTNLTKTKKTIIIV